MAEERMEAEAPRAPIPGPPPMPGEMAPAQHARDAKGTLFRLLKYVKPQIPLIALSMAFALLATLFNIVTPKILGNATTLIYSGARAIAAGEAGARIDIEQVQLILIAVLLMYAANGIFKYAQQYVMAQVTQNTVFSLRQEVERKLNRLPLSFYDRAAKGDVLSRVVNDVDLIASTLQDSITQTLTAAVTFVGVLAVMLWISPLMTLIAVATVPLSLVITVAVARRSQRLFVAQQASLGKLDAHIEETYGGHTEVKAFCHEAAAVAEFERVNEAYFRNAWLAQFISGIVRPAMMLVGNFAYVAVCIVGAWQCTLGLISVGDIQAFIQYTRSFSMPIEQLASIANIIQSTLAAAERVFEIMDEPEMDEGLLEVPACEEAERGHVVFSHVRFGYLPGQAVIRDLSVSVQPGQMVAIVGPTGAGKSTLVNLLMRFYEIDGGRIFLNGRDIRTMERGELRAHFGMVLQDTWLFNGSIRDNIAYGAPAGVDVSDEMIVRAAKAAHVDQFVRQLPAGYDTVINEEGSNISAGQKQLLTIARALLADPEILLLDEATSSIDTRTERLVQQAMRDLAANRTSFVIAHRLSTIQEADLILVLNEGDIVEQGTHEQLLAAGGFYASLYNSQFVDCIDPVDETDEPGFMPPPGGMPPGPPPF